MKTKELFDYTVEATGHVIHYRRLESGTCYHQETPEGVVDILENARICRHRVRIFLGDRKTGEDWGEEYDVIGYIGRSGGGIIHVPLLLPSNRSMGGGAILDHCIIKINRDRRTVYQAPGYQCGIYTIRDGRWKIHGKLYKAEVSKNKKVVANFESREKAERWVAFMKGERDTKGGRIKRKVRFPIEIKSV